MGRNKKEATEVINIRVQVKLADRYRELAKKEYRSFTEQCNMALEKWINEQKSR